jgi:hypothetical protein
MASEPTRETESAPLSSDRSAGVALALGSVLSVLMMAHHPTAHGHNPPEFVAEVTEHAAVNEFVHGALIALMGVLIYGFSGLALRLGMHTFWARGGLIAYLMGATAGIAAALFNGFTIPEYVARYQNRPAEELATMMQMLSLGGEASHVCARVWIVGLSIAVALWSVPLVHRPGLSCAAGVFGCVVGALPVLGLLTGHLRLHVHGALAFVLGQAVWTLIVAVQLIRNRL